jgi:hypothetical protein
MFVGKVRSLLKRRARERPYLETLDRTGKDCQGQTLWLIVSIRKLKSVIILDSGVHD